MRVLLFSVENWLSQARMPQTLKKAGWEVGAFCRKGSYLSKTRWLDRQFYSSFTNATEIHADFARAIKNWQPRLILPVDDPSVLMLQDVFLRASGGALDAGEEGVACLRRSLPDPAAFPLTRSKFALLDRARERGVRIPAQRELFTMGHAGSFVEEHGYPVVVKPQFGFAGRGVSICSSEDELVEALEECLPQLAQSRVRTPMFIEQFVSGRPILLHAACRDGGMLASYQIERLVAHPHTPALTSVLRVVDNPEVRSLGMTLINELGANGLLAIEFILGEDGLASLIEINFRMAPQMHMASRIGVNLPAALMQAQLGILINRGRPNIGHEIACYPYEIMRDPSSPYLKEHDVIEDDEPLQAAFDQYIATHGGVVVPDC